MSTAAVRPDVALRPSAAAKRTRLGELLIAEGLITQDQLDLALAEQKRLKLPLGKTLVSLNYLNDAALRQALARQMRVPFIDLATMQIDPALSRMLSRAYARSHGLVPVSRIGHTLTVAVDDPTATGLSMELSRLTGLTVTIVTATTEAIQQAYRVLYEGSRVSSAPRPVTAAPRPAHATIPFPSPATAAGTGGDELLNRIVEKAIESRSSDIHLEMLGAGLRLRFRVDGLLRPASLGQVQEIVDQNAREIISRIKILAKLDISERRRPQDGSFQTVLERGGAKVTVDLRVSILPSYTGESVVIRILDRTRAPRDLKGLGLSPNIQMRLEKALHCTTGIVLVTGPTGSGKSTTLYSCLMKLHRPEIRILTAEDPVEYVYEELSQSEVNDEIGNTFASFLRSFLRHDPEVIMIGEIRDEETAEMAFRAAQTGHLLLSTLHTNSAIETLPRLIDLKVDPSMIGSTLNAVMSQRLVRRLCPACRKPGALPALVKEFFGDVHPDFTLYQPVGCPECEQSGYRGRFVLVDLWIPDDEDLLLITRRAPFEEIVRSAARTTISMAADAHERLRAGQTTMDELLRVMPYSSIIGHRALVNAKPSSRLIPEPARPHVVGHTRS
jgi:type II secretory ATPase GspE/PulE/Tfp pilus assembly ATPase PilB-like protein